MTARSVLNLADIGFGQYPFINFIKTATLASGPSDYPSLLDVNNYPTTAPSSNIVYNPINLPTSYTGNWVIDWVGVLGGVAALQIAVGGTTIISGGEFVVGATTFNLSMKGTNGRVVFSFATPPSSIVLNILAVGTYTGFTNLRLYRADQEASLIAGEIFNPDYITQLRELNPKVLRFLDWASGNVNWIGDAGNLPPSAVFSYETGYWNPPIWVGDAAGTNTYTASNGSGHNPLAYQDGESVQCRFLNANTSTTVTFERGGLGPKAVVSATGLNTAAALDIGQIAANQRGTVTYSAILGKWLFQAEALPHQIPLAIIFALCNKLSMDCWLPMSLMYTDTAWQTIAAAAKSGLNPGLRFWPEVSNECWNGNFPGTILADSIGGALGFAVANSERHMSYYALRTRQVFAAIATTWAAAPARPSSELKRVNAFQAFGDPNQNEIYRFLGRNLFSQRSVVGAVTIASPTVVTLTSQSVANNNIVKFTATTGALPTGLLLNTDYYVVNHNTATGTGNLSATQGGAAINTSGSQSGTHTVFYTNVPYQSRIGVDYNVAPNRPIDFVEILAYATYYNGVIPQAFDGNYTAPMTELKAWADDYASGNATLMTGALNSLDSDLRGTTTGETLGGLNTNIYPAWNALAVTYSKQVANYEGALQIIAPSTGQLTALGIDTAYSAKIATLFNAYKTSALFKVLVRDQYQQFAVFSKSLYPCWYYFCFGTTSEWSTHVGDLYSIKYKSYDAIVEWNGGGGPILRGGGWGNKRNIDIVWKMKAKNLRDKKTGRFKPDENIVISQPTRTL